MDSVVPLRGHGAIAAVGADALLERLRGGAQVKGLADEFGVKEASVYEYLLRHVPEEWKAIWVGRALERLDAAQAALDDAVATREQVDVSRAQARLRAAQWFLERAGVKHFGDSKVGDGGVQVNVFVNRDGVVSAVRVSEKGALSGEFSAVAGEEDS